jgi:hypothetical protein
VEILRWIAAAHLEDARLSAARALEVGPQIPAETPMRILEVAVAVVAYLSALRVLRGQAVAQELTSNSSLIIRLRAIPGRSEVAAAGVQRERMAVLEVLADPASSLLRNFTDGFRFPIFSDHRPTGIDTSP